MKRLVILLSPLLGLVACSEPPTDSGQVIDKDYEHHSHHTQWYLKLEGVVSHNRVVWWYQVEPAVWTNCRIGDRWDIDNPRGCR